VPSLGSDDGQTVEGVVSGAPMSPTPRSSIGTSNTKLVSSNGPEVSSPIVMSSRVVESVVPLPPVDPSQPSTVQVKSVRAPHPLMTAMQMRRTERT